MPEWKLPKLPHDVIDTITTYGDTRADQDESYNSGPALAACVRAIRDWAGSLAASPPPPHGLEPRGCPTPGACSCPMPPPQADIDALADALERDKWHVSAVTLQAAADTLRSLAAAARVQRAELSDEDIEI